jgi:hypothetical protein
MSSNNKERKDSTFDNNNKEDSKVEKEKKPAAKGTTIIDITKAGTISRDILDITDTPDVAAWNKSIQGRERMAQAKVTPTANNTAIGLKKKGYDRDSIIDPANQKDVDEVVNSGGTLTDKA